MIFKLGFCSVLIICLVFQATCFTIQDELDALDKTMLEELDLKSRKEAEEEQCVKPRLGYCKDDVTYPIAKAQAVMHLFYEGLVESAIDSLTLETRGSVLSCKQDLKRLICRDRFPPCAQAQIDWQDGSEKCGRVLEKCPQEVRDKMMQFDFCNKLNNGKKNVTECVTPLVLNNMKYCVVNKNDHVSPWNYHSAIEIESLLDVQTSLWDLSKQCVHGLSKYLCSPAKSCFAGKEAAKMLKQYKESCREAIKTCSNDVVSRAIKDIFLNCD